MNRDVDIHLEVTEPTVEDQLRALGVTRVRMVWDPAKARAGQWLYDWWGRDEGYGYGRVDELGDVFRYIIAEITEDNEGAGF